jgi:mannose-6-phosphate isomerase-like protein (cupin superfamily)
MIAEAFGVAPSTVSRRFIGASTWKLKELTDRKLDGCDIIALVIDGKSFKDDEMIIALGITIEGKKRIVKTEKPRAVTSVGGKMIVRNIRDKEVPDTIYLAHGGAIAQMIPDRRILKEIGFLAIAMLAPGKTIEAHVDPMEEIYFIMTGEGEMTADNETRHVKPGDATWSPAGASYALTNSGPEDCVILVIASPEWC